MTNKYKEFLSSLDRSAYHDGEYQWEEDGYTVTRTYHYSPPGCHDSCGILTYVKDGKLEKIEGDPLSPVVNGRLCIRCINLVESVNHPERLKYPMKRIGERGEGKFERISWDEAWAIITEKTLAIQKQYGGSSIILAHGTGRNIMWQAEYLANAGLKTRNIATQFFTGFACYLPRVIGSIAPMGDFAIVDASESHEDRYLNEEWRPPEVLLVWGNEPLKSNGDGYMGHWLVPCVQMGTKIISIDPVLTWWSSRAEYWLQIRPGTDGALAVALLNTIIYEDLYDHDFVDCWCYGFDRLAEHVKEMTAEWAAPITGLEASDIRAVARLFAAANPGAIQSGLAMDQQLSAMQLCGAIVDLIAITGNVDVPGGMLLVRDGFGMNRKQDFGSETLPAEVWEEKLTAGKLGYGCKDFMQHASSDTITKAIETEDPYPIKMFWIQSTNALSCAGMSAGRTYEALKKMDFVVVADPFLTPTAVAVADVVLPVAMSAERSGVRVWWTPMRSMSKVCEFYEAKSDEWIIVEAVKHLHPEDASMNTEEDFLNAYIALGGAAKDIHEVAVDNLGYKYCPWDATYYKYAKGLLRGDGQPGFNTPTGRVELYSLIFEDWGVPPLPSHIEPPEGPLSTPELFREYPIIITTGARSYEFFHSEHRQHKTMRELHPLPRVLINPKTATEYGIEDGEWIWMESPEGRFKQKAKFFAGIRPGTISAEHGWWFPEREAAEPSLFGTFDSNPNNLTRQFVTGVAGVGSPIKGMICKIYRAQDGDTLPGVEITRLGGFKRYIPGKEGGTKYEGDPCKQ